MLYDPRWEQRQQDHILVSGLLAWLEEQDGSTEYSWAFNPRNCLINAYRRGRGLPATDCTLMPQALKNIAILGERTYRGASERCRKFLQPHTAG